MLVCFDSGEPLGGPVSGSERGPSFIELGRVHSDPSYDVFVSVIPSQRCMDPENVSSSVCIIIYIFFYKSGMSRRIWWDLMGRVVHDIYTQNSLPK